MLPWLFAILVLLNVGLFIWGYQREKSLEPPSLPVPVGRYEIRLRGETEKDPERSAGTDGSDTQDQAPADGRPALAGDAEGGR